MKALIYILQRTIINYFKRIKEKPQKAIGPIFILLWLTFLFNPMAGSKSGKLEYIDIFVTVFVLITVVIFLFSLYGATKSVDSKFTMSDVNLVFVSPIRPQTVLLYGIIKKIALGLFASIYILYQIPNFLKNYNIPGINQAMLVISYAIYQLVLCNIIKLFVFALTTKYKKLGEIIRTVIKGIALLSAAAVVLTIVNKSFISIAKAFCYNLTYASYVKYIPIFGWMKELALQTVTKINLSYSLYIILMFLVCGLLLYITYNMNLDYYEDMLSSAEQNEVIKTVKSGNKYTGDLSANRKQSRLLKPFKKVKLKLENAYGAKVVFFKHINEYAKRSLIFFINSYSLFLLIISVTLGILANGMEIKYLLLGASVLLLFTCGFGGKIYTEINYYFIFLIPDKPQKKLFYGVASSLIKVFTDAVILFIPFGILRRASILEIILCIICYLVLGGMLSYSGLFAFRIAEFLGLTGPVSQGILFMFFQLFLIVPAVLLIILTAYLSGFNSYVLYATLSAYSIIAAILFSLGCVGIFDHMEFR